jgi:hypothetical protein
MKTATFNPKGGPITAEVSVGFAPEAAIYDLRIHSPKMLQFFVVAEGVNANEGPNTHVLPGTLAGKDQRVVRCLATIGELQVGDPFRVGLELFQDGKRIGKDAEEDTATDVDAFVDVQIRLIKGAAK